MIFDCLSKILKKYSNLIYPSFCKSCEILIEQDSIFCTDCFSRIKPIVSSYLQITPTKTIKVFAVSDYKDPLKSLILEKSYSANILASKQLAQIIYKKTQIKNFRFDYLIPVPIHWIRFSKRGYNQAFEISKELGRDLDILVLDVIKRVKYTKFQSNFSFEQRQENVRDIFDLNNKSEKFYLTIKEKIIGKDLLLVDDLCTTGATLKNLARFLLKFNPKSITAIVACRVV